MTEQTPTTPCFACEGEGGRWEPSPDPVRRALDDGRWWLRCPVCGGHGVVRRNLR